MIHVTFSSSLRCHCPSLLDAQCLKAIVLCILIISGRRASLVPASPCWLEVEVFPGLWLLLKTFLRFSYFILTVPLSCEVFFILTLLLLLLNRFSHTDSVRPQRWQPTRFPRPWDSPGKNAGVRCHFLLQCMKVKSESEVAQSCLTLSDSMDCSLPGSSIHGIFQARVLEWGATTFSL